MKRALNIIILNISLLGAIVFSIAIIDRPLSNFIAENLANLIPFFNSFTIISDKIIDFILYNLFGSLPFFLLFSFIIGVVCFLSTKAKQIGFIFLTLVFAYPTTTILTNIIKSEFKRARPVVDLKNIEKNADFYSEQTPNDSFPSAHASVYLSLFLPAALAYRRFAFFILLIPGLVILGRIVQNHHYLSDVLFSIVFVFDFCFLTYLLFNRLDRILANIKNIGINKRKTTNKHTFMQGGESSYKI